MKFDPQAHHRRSIRLRDYDYSQPGEYFVTIVTYQRECLFGEIVESEMKVNKCGLVARQQWDKMPKRFANIALGRFIVMPNHIHGIVEIVEDSRRGTAEDLHIHGVEPDCCAPTREFGKMIPGSIPTIVRSHKSAVTYRINLIRNAKGIRVWQRNDYEHIIRDTDDLNRITRYIEFNPYAWKMDDENPGIIRNVPSGYNSEFKRP